VNPAARVIPDVASFAVDNGFWYTIPDHLGSEVTVGSIVRVPLSGRRVRGWVMEIAPERSGKLKEISGVSGAGPVFDGRLLESLIWAARHYVAPVSTLVSRSSPPNLPRSIPSRSTVPEIGEITHPISGVVARSANGRNNPVTAIVANWRDLDWLDAFGPLLSAGKSVLVIAASVAEVGLIGDRAAQRWGRLAVTVTGEDDAGDTRAWQWAQSPPRIVIGTPKTSAWMVAGMGLALVLEESRRAMKDRQTPTLHVRDVLRTRSRIEGFNLVFYGPTPGVELLAAGAEVLIPGNRAWPLVEVVDRSDEPPGSGYLSGRVVAALKSVVDGGDRAFVFTHRRVGYASTRCTACRTLHACVACGARLGRVEQCPKCGTPTGPCSNCGGLEFEEMGTIPERLLAEIGRRVGSAGVTGDGEPSIVVGTERDLASLERVTLAVAADVDGMLVGGGYRTEEEALRQLARLATMVAPGRGARLMLQTSRPDSLLVTTMRRGDPIPYLERVLVERARDGSPPSSEMIVIEVRGDVPNEAEHDLTSLGPEVAVMGPMTVEDGQRWLLTGKLGKARLELRRIVGRWRDRGATVRVDVDPIDV
jgi:primosomal protein N' (replication factor Y) (superfamily II helicase)